ILRGVLVVIAFTTTQISHGSDINNPCGIGKGLFHKYPADCRFYYVCASPTNAVKTRCPPGLVYRSTTEFCDFNDDDGCDISKFKGHAGEIVDTNVKTGAKNGGSCKRVVCFYPRSAQFKKGIGKVMPGNLDPKHCTHLIYGFASIKNGFIKLGHIDDESSAFYTGMYARIMALREANPSLKILLAIEGSDHAPRSFLTLTESSKHQRLRFIQSSIKHLRKFQFDGLAYHWIYPKSGDKMKFTELLKDTKAAFEDESTKTQTERLLLTAAVAANVDTAQNGYEIDKIFEHLDFAYLMSFDFHGPQDPATAHGSPLRAGRWERGSAGSLNLEKAAEFYANKGAPKDRLVLGIPFHGKTFTLKDEQLNAFGSPSKGPGEMGDYSQEPGTLYYYEICKMITKGATVNGIPDQNVPYAYLGNQWVGFDDPASITMKIDFMIFNGYGGVMAWDISQDDMSGQFCGAGRFPLMNAVRSACDA
ncbi:hypothetical protein EGW08_000807, partial [Elysia chlorotica]